MTTEVLRPDWRVIGRSVRGFSHRRHGLPNQDSIGWSLSDTAATGVVLAASDGHGSPRSFRSDRGAAIAVFVALQVMQGLLDMYASGADPTSVEGRLVERAPQDLVRSWADAVTADLHAMPPTGDELNALAAKYGDQAAESAKQNPLVAYGATVIAVAATDAFVAYLQLGDGDIVAVHPDGDAVRPLPADDRLFANETTSLCLPEAWRDVRCKLQPIHDLPPPLILLSTDGYSNSFRDDAGFMKVGPDLLRVVRSEGLEYLDHRLEEWLTTTSERGSGDDITLGVVCNVNGIGETAGAADDDGTGKITGAGASARELSAEAEGRQE